MAEEAENLEELLNTFKVQEGEAGSSDHIIENKQTSLKLAQSKFEQLPEKTETAKPGSQAENKLNQNLAPFE
jgi:hypothetical protein